LIKKYLKRFGEKAGLTEAEITGILFFAVMLLTGLTVRHFNNEQTSLPSFDYSGQDSLFLRLKALNDSLSTVDTLNIAARTSGESKKSQMLFNRKININLASKDDLTMLPGVGEKTAIIIITYRSQNGRFRKPEEIMDIKGIGPAKFAKMREYISVK